MSKNRCAYTKLTDNATYEYRITDSNVNYKNSYENQHKHQQKHKCMASIKDFFINLHIILCDDD